MAKEKISVLVIDDEPDVRDTLKNILERKGYSVLAAQDGQEGIKIVENQDVTVVICDIAMPKMDGLEFLKHVHDFKFKAEVVMITGQSSLDRCVEAIEYGACGYLIKPLKMDDILDSVKGAVKRFKEKRDMLIKALEDSRRHKKEG